MKTGETDDKTTKRQKENMTGRYLSTKTKMKFLCFELEKWSFCVVLREKERAREGDRDPDVRSFRSVGSFRYAAQPRESVDAEFR